ncbi:glutathione peroxidase [Roseateles terrae]|uniref:Glutathione peroxidase n=1 Tax=Roseateles terrae TaxID=431060 RepID=A0ABR6GV68_9BURK|nr:glutathione peroxidase [Roseateles terrae]MBB3196008.1 glutathione peroxidase [Roseateles terrae]OWQ85510.1 glutathione peroxidase [Roseateles terrae]
MSQSFVSTLFPRLALVLTAACATLAAPSAQAAGPAAAAPATTAAAAGACPDVLQRQFPRLQDEKPQPLCQYAGKVVLVVNTASFCGFTPQYKALEALSSKYKDLAVLGFPSGDFGNQEYGSDKEIAEFCENTFNVKFPMFSKSSVAAGKTDLNPLFADLAKRTGQAPKWNFHKYLISRDGQQVMSFGSKVDPQGAEFTQALEKMLKQN